MFTTFTCLKTREVEKRKNNSEQALLECNMKTGQSLLAYDSTIVFSQVMNARRLVSEFRP